MRVWTAILLSLTSVAAYAGVVADSTPTLPEPGTLALFAAAGVVALVLKHRNKK